MNIQLEFVRSEHSVQGISNFRHRLHSDKERKVNPTPNLKMSKLQGRAAARPWEPALEEPNFSGCSERARSSHHLRHDLAVLVRQARFQASEVVGQLEMVQAEQVQ